MVSSIIPGAAGAQALGVDERFVRNNGQSGGAPREEARVADRVELNAARDSVRSGLAQVHLALAAGHDAQATLVRMQGVAQGGESNAQAQLDELLSGLQARIEAAVAQGATLLKGDALMVEAEPGAAPVAVAGADLRVKGEPAASDVVQVRAGAQVGDETLVRDVQASLEKLQQAMERLLDAARSLEAHQGFLGAAEGAQGVRHDLSADSARLLALQVRQGLSAAGAQPIANVEPQAVLSLFRA
ncbi:MAG: hypothetical protein AB7G05_13905 [Hyphomonadaceae bacterium]